MTNPQSNPDPLARGLLFLYVETPLHVGCGEGLGAIDLPIQRERMSDLPVVPGSGIKGALREIFCRQGSTVEPDIFGPRPPDPQNGGSGEAPEHAGALALTDAKLLLLPIRTVYGGWAWATSPMILERLAREHLIAGRGAPAWGKLLRDLNGKDQTALVFKSNPSIASPNNKVILEDTLYSAELAPAAAKPIVDLLKSALPTCESYGPMRERLADQLVLLSDTELKFWAKHGTEVTTRVRIDENTGTVAKGALWTEESLPAESLLWSVALMSHSRKPNKGGHSSGHNGDELMRTFTETLRAKSRLFLGGDRTIGRGLCGVNLLPGAK